MGAWGAGPFDNDCAGDWLDSLLEGKSVRPIGTALARGLKSPDDADIESFAIAAAEVVATARQHPTAKSPELVEWLRERQFVPDEALVEQAQRAVENIQKKSELAELWAGDAQWKRAMQRLAKALSQPAGSPSVGSKRTKAASGESSATKQLRRLLKKLYCVVDPSRGDAITSISCIGEMTDKVLQALEAVAATLEILTIDSGQLITDLGLQSIGRFTRLKQLSVKNGSAITDAGVAHLRSLKSLEMLELSRCPKVTAAGIAYFSECRKLTDLRLGGTPVGDACATTIAEFRNLKQLWLRGTGLTDRGLRQLCEFPKLRMFFLARTAITDDGLGDLAKLPKLAWLDLESTQITDQGIRVLTDCKTLQALDVMGTAITDKSVPEILKLQKLCYLNVEDTKISEQGKRDLNQNLPHINDDAARQKLY